MTPGHRSADRAIGPRGRSASRELDGKIALLHCPSAGLSSRIGRGLADDGTRVISSSGPRPPAVSRTACAEWFDETVKEVEGIDILVNCLTLPKTGSIARTTAEAWGAVRQRLEPVFLVCQAAVPGMRADGCITNICLIPDQREPAEGLAAEAISAGLAAFTREVALQCARQDPGIRCNSIHARVCDPVSPGESGNQDEPLGDEAEATVEQITGLVSLLSSSATGFATGSQIEIGPGRAPV